MFARRDRLSRQAIPILSSSGRRISSKNFSAVVGRENTGENLRGYAVIIPKKVARLSVARHLLKRRVFAVLLATPLPRALIIFPRASAADLTYAEIHEELTKLLSNSV